MGNRILISLGIGNDVFDARTGQEDFGKHLSDLLTACIESGRMWLPHVNSPAKPPSQANIMVTTVTVGRVHGVHDDSLVPGRDTAKIKVPKLSVLISIDQDHLDGVELMSGYDINVAIGNFCRNPENYVWIGPVTPVFCNNADEPCLVSLAEGAPKYARARDESATATENEEEDADLADFTELLNYYPTPRYMC